MKKIFISVLLVILILSACNFSASTSTSTLSFSKVENIPNIVQEKIDSDFKLQLINDGQKGSYIIFQASGNVKTDVETQGDTVIIKLNVTNPQNEVINQNIYYLTTDPKHEKIDVLVNGKSIPFDNVTGL